MSIYGEKFKNLSWIRRLSLIVFAISLTACAEPSHIAHQEPPPQIAATPYYLSADAMTTFKVGPPPAIGSLEDQEGIKALKTIQATRTQADCDRARAIALPVNPAYDEFFGDMGPFQKPLSGEARGFIIRIWSDSSFVSNVFKSKYKWPRAYAIDGALQPCLEKTNNPAFPSGHALTARIFALILSDIVPEKRSVYLDRAEEIARDRFVAGMHRPSEIEAGKVLADQIYTELLKSASFLRDLAKAQILVEKRKP